MIESSEPSVQKEIPPQEEIRFSPLAKRLTVFIVVGLLALFLLHVAEALPPFIWAIVTAFIFNIPVKLLQRRFGRPRWVWVVTVFLSFILLLVLALVFLIPAITKEAKTLATDLPNIRSTVDDYLNKNPTVNIAGMEVEADTVRGTINNVLERLPGIAQDLGPRLVSQTFRFLVDFLLYLIASFYLLLAGGRGIVRFIESLPLQYRDEMGSLFGRINTVLSAYLKGQVLLILIMSVTSFIILTILGVRYALLLGIMVGILELVPFVGPYLAISVCSLVAFFQPHGNFGLSGIPLVILVVVCLFILRQLEDYVVIPNIIGRIVELPALLVIFSIVTGAALLGPMGLLLAVPIVAVIKIVLGYLYYKLVDADRQKLVVPAETSYEGLVKLLNNYPPRSRLLIITEPEAEFLNDPVALKELRQLSKTKALDVAFYCGQEEEKVEKVSHQLQVAGFPLITMEQEHFLNSRTVKRH
jgi:predicted PurR-regulated permease PerM